AWMPASLSRRTRSGGRAGPGKIAATAPGSMTRPSPYTDRLGIWEKVTPGGMKPPSVAIRRISASPAGCAMAPDGDDPPPAQPASVVTKSAATLKGASRRIAGGRPQGSASDLRQRRSEADSGSTGLTAGRAKRRENGRVLRRSARRHRIRRLLLSLPSTLGLLAI